jgi:hypothetical protein
MGPQLHTSNQPTIEVEGVHSSVHRLCDQMG